MKKSTRLKIIIILLCSLTVIFYSVSLALYEKTIVNPYILLSIAGFLSVISGVTMWRFWRRITDKENFLINYMCHVVFSFGFLLFSYLTINIIFKNESEEYREGAEVENVYSKTRYKTKRVGRRYVRGDEYKAYFMKINLKDDVSKEIQITLAKTRHLHKGDSVNVVLCPGFLGSPVITKVRPLVEQY